VAAELADLTTPKLSSITSSIRRSAKTPDFGPSAPSNTGDTATVTASLLRSKEELVVRDDADSKTASEGAAEELRGGEASRLPAWLLASRPAIFALDGDFDKGLAPLDCLLL
jgi:hypothetical protein